MIKNRLLPFSKIELETVEKKFSTPVWVTSEKIIKAKCIEMIESFRDLNIKIFYAMKANYNPSYIKIIKNSGIYGIDTVSVNEIKFALSLGYKPEQIIFTPSNASTEEIIEVANLNILQNFGSLSEIERFGENFSGGNISVRLSPGIGAGESNKINTGGDSSKFGVMIKDFESVKNLSKKYNFKIKGLHFHLGSGFYSSKEFEKAIKILFDISRSFKDIEFLDLGGGFGVQYNTEKEEINLKDFAKVIKEPLENLNKEQGKNIEIRIEPGKYLISQSTVLLTKVTNLSKKNDIFVGTDTGFNHLIRPAMYSAYHNIVNISSNDSLEKVKVAGNVCETCDIFNEGALMSKAKEGDLLAILVAGGYGSSMSSNYNMRQFASEVLVNEKNEIILTKKRQNYDQIIENFVNY
jgi:diaminopimelate decarboxylase